jgi:hypothetical protein
MITNLEENILEVPSRIEGQTYTLAGAVDFPVKDAGVEVQIDVYTSIDGGLIYEHRLGAHGLRGDHVPFAPPSDPTNPYTFKLSYNGLPCRAKVVIQTTQALLSVTTLRRS